MAEKFIIEMYRTKNPDDLTKLLADPASKLDTGSAAALNMAVAASLLSRAAALCVKEGRSGEELDYVVRNAETLRNYMVYLIDEDVKCKNPLRQAEKKGEEKNFEACRRPAVSICQEIVGMAGTGLELCLKLASFCSADSKIYVEQFVYTAMAAVKTAISYILCLSSKSSDETYRYVTKRENEMTLENYENLCKDILSRLSQI